MKEQQRIAYHTLGCKLNFSETSTIARSFEEEGYTKTDFNQEADVYVINTCSVTENADKQFKQVVRKAMKLNDKAFVAAVGCYAQLKPEELANVDGVEPIKPEGDCSYHESISKNVWSDWSDVVTADYVGLKVFSAEAYQSDVRFILGICDDVEEMS